MENSSIENVASSLVREYLSRKGLKGTLQTMDSEMPRSEGSISNRLQLAKELHLEYLMKKNKECSPPLRAMLEVMTKYFLQKIDVGREDKRQSSRPSSRMTSERPSSRSGSHSKAPSEDSGFHSNQSNHHAKQVSRGSASDLDIHNVDDEEGMGSTAISDVSKAGVHSNVEESPVKLKKEASSKMATTEARDTAEPTQAKKSRPGSSRGLRSGMMSGPIMSSQDNRTSRRGRVPSNRPNLAINLGTENKLDLTKEPSRVDSPVGKYSESKLSSSTLSSTLTRKDSSSDSNLGSEKSLYVAKDSSKKVGILTEEENYLQDSKRTTSASKLIKSTSLDEKTVGSRTKSQDKRRKSAEPESLAAKLDGKISPTPNNLSQTNRASSNPSEILTDISQDTLTEQLAARREARAKTRPKTSENGGSSRMDKLKERLKSLDDSFDDDGVDNSKSRKSTSSSSNTKKFGDLEMGDVDDLEDDLGDLALSAPAPSIKPLADAQPITAETATELKTLLFGSASEQFNAEWRNQSLGFCETEGLRFGIVQNKGGPCGALAAIQACMLKRLLFGEARNKTANAHRLLSPDSRLRSESLALGLADLLWRAGRKKLAVVAMPSGRKQFQGGARYRQDNLTETLMLNSVDSQEDLEAFIKQNISLFETNQYATILVLYSAILSRTIDHVISDMDEPTTKLIGAHGYCTQEMVNLFLTGKAVSNVFNDTVELDSGGGENMILRGVGSRSEIGLLSLFEHYRSCQVGTYMKTPRYPIWVVCSESHFSVLFCLRKELMNDWKYERRFDLYYYDGLARQDEQIRLTVDNLHPYEPPGEGELVPPLEHCIRTK
ncbi:probable ubiquitin carboxyl-terminal hydrolase MINDY-4 [Branchiostoma lanceolatum]|uniref:probable ubiquitin carboxyl-terminal hydrolase MINDY-4 n=1 Tax=Branchiostoma lanceolatum TaxID=7740 RepID=UPI0034531BAD